MRNNIGYSTPNVSRYRVSDTQCVQVSGIEGLRRLVYPVFGTRYTQVSGIEAVGGRAD